MAEWFKTLPGFDDVLPQDVAEYRQSHNGLTFPQWWSSGNRANVRFRRLRLWWRRHAPRRAPDHDDTDDQHADEMMRRFREIIGKDDVDELSGGGRVHEWRNHIPASLVRVWDDLPPLAKLTAVVVAKHAADEEEWD